MKEIDFLNAGFVKDEVDPMFPFFYNIIPNDVIEENEIPEDDVPKLLFGNTGINQGFCIYTGFHFVWFNAENPLDAIQFAERITNFEEV